MKMHCAGLLLLLFIVLSTTAKTNCFAEDASVADWTLLVFMNGKNNLESFALADVNEMELPGSSEKINVVVELGRSKGNDTSDGDWKGARRFRIEKDSDPAIINSAVLEEIPGADMGDWKHLAEFVAWGKRRFPAKKYMLVIWDHGNGWKAAGEPQKSISMDDETGSRITTEQIGLAMASAGKVDVFAMDACIMQMAEVAWEVRNYSDFILASEEVVPNEGQRYDLLVSALLAEPAMSARQLGTAAVNVYGDHYSSLKRYSTMSLIRSDGLEKFAELLDDWAASVRSKSERLAVSQARNGVQQFWYDDNIDIYDLVKRVNGTDYLSAIVAEKGRVLLDFMDSGFIVANRTVSNQYKNAHGLSVYMPKQWLDPAYRTLSWSQQTKWSDFCAWMLGHT